MRRVPKVTGRGEQVTQVNVGTTHWGGLTVKYMEGSNGYSREEIVDAINHTSKHFPGAMDNVPAGSVLQVGKADNGIKMALLKWNGQKIKFLNPERSHTTKALLRQVAKELERENFYR